MELDQFFKSSDKIWSALERERTNYSIASLLVKELCADFASGYDDWMRLAQGPHDFDFEVSVTRPDLASGLMVTDIARATMNVEQIRATSYGFSHHTFGLLDKNGMPHIYKSLAIDLARGIWQKQKGHGIGATGSKNIVKVSVREKTGEYEFSYGDTNIRRKAKRESVAQPTAG